MNVIMLAERIAYDHKGITIYIDLDYERGVASFTEKDGRAKNYKFAQRTRKYLGGWYLILEALQEATRYADTRLEEQAKAREQVKEKKMVDLMVALADIKNGEQE